MMVCLALAGCRPPAQSPLPAADALLSPTLVAPTHTGAPSPTPSLTPLPATPTLTPTITPTPFIEPPGCLAPPDDYTLTKLNGWLFNRRTAAMLEHAAGLYGGQIDITGAAITQGSYTDNEPASFGTHRGGGALDLSVMARGSYTVLYDEIEPLIYALRVAGFAAWLRDLDELYPGSPIHIHAVAIGDEHLSPAARDQLSGKFGYFYGYNGLPKADGIPAPDPHGGPVLCRWMLELGYADLRPAGNTH